MIDIPKTPEQQQEDIDKRIERFQRELNWLKAAWEKGDVRIEMATLMVDHFSELNTITIEFATLLEMMQPMLSEEDHERLKPTVERIFKSIMTVKGHNDRFAKLFENLPDKHDMLLATVDTPPHMM